MKAFLRKAISFLPLKKQVYLMVRTITRFPENVYKHLFFKGKFWVKVSKGIGFNIIHHGYQIENEIFWCGIFGGWEKDSMKIWAMLAESSQTIVDVGANTGVYSLLAQAVNSDAKVFAFEPVERVFAKLERNIALNKFDITPVKVALSNSNGKAIIYDTNAEHTYSVTVNENHLDSNVGCFEVEIDIVRLDDFCGMKSINKIDLMKVDVELHEPAVFEGYGVLLAIHRPFILVEILTVEIGSRMQDVLEGLEYEYYSVLENKTIKREDHLIPNGHYNYLLCPSEKYSLFEALLSKTDIVVD